MSKEALTFLNFDDGLSVADINGAIAAINAALDMSDAPKAKGEVTIKVTIQNADDSGDFRTMKVEVKPPKLPTRLARASLFPVQNFHGKRTLVVDSDQVGDQLIVPGIATGGGAMKPVSNLADARAAAG